jgi:SpoVK/Ycf46/Vps4 family AAA+-type ATPase
VEYIDRLTCLIKAQIPAIAIRTREEARALEVIHNVAGAMKNNRRVLYWSSASGTQSARIENDRLVFEQATGADSDLVSALTVALRDRHTVLVIRGAGEVLAGPMQRFVKEAIDGARRTQSSIIFVGHDVKAPASMSNDIWFMELPLPDADEIREMLEPIVERYVELAKTQDDVKADSRVVPALVRAMTGLTRQEINNIINLSIVEDRGITQNAVAVALREKDQAVKREGLVEVEPTPKGMSGVGGCKVLKNFAKGITGLFTPEAKAAGIDTPKGVLFAGPAGTGKSLCARAFAAEFGVPLVRVDVGRIFGSLVGESESNLRRIIQIVESVSPCVMLLDEVDKSLAKQSGSGDSGTSQRVFGAILQWMQDKTSEVFVVATANNIDKLDSAFLRKGRFDEIFGIDLPTIEARQEIVRIHAKGIALTESDVWDIAICMEGFVGAEIRAVIQAARVEAFNSKVKPTCATIKKHARACVPLSRTMSQEVNYLREQIKSGRIRNAEAELESSTAESELELLSAKKRKGV